jgi:hypothetical protein
MLQKIGGLARAAGVLVSIVTAFAAIPTLDTALLLVVLGLVAGLALTDADRVGIIVTALVLPLVATVLNTLPAIGSQLGTVASNLGVLAASSVVTVIATRLFNVVKGDLAGLASK